MADVYAPIIAEARRRVAAGRPLDRDAVEAEISAASKRAGSTVGEKRALEQLARLVSVQRARTAVAREPAPRPAQQRPAALRTRPTITGNMDVRREGDASSLMLKWDAAPAVTSWEIRISERPDARRDYDVRETLNLAGNETGVSVPLSDRAIRVHILGRGRGGRLVRRAIVSGLTSDSWRDRWQRRASAS